MDGVTAKMTSKMNLATSNTPCLMYLREPSVIYIFRPPVEPLRWGRAPQYFQNELSVSKNLISDVFDGIICTFWTRHISVESSKWEFVPKNFINRFSVPAIRVDKCFYSFSMVCIVQLIFVSSKFLVGTRLRFFVVHKVIFCDRTRCVVWKL